jgi:hypothetical protein
VFLVTGCFQGRPRPRFTVGIVGLVGFWGTSRVGKGASSSSNSAGASGLSGSVVASSSSSSAVASSSSNLTSWVSSGRK